MSAKKKMNTYVVLIRGINVGGKNKVPMAGLKRMLGTTGIFQCFNLYCQW